MGLPSTSQEGLTVKSSPREKNKHRFEDGPQGSWYEALCVLSIRNKTETASWTQTTPQSPHKWPRAIPLPTAHPHTCCPGQCHLLEFLPVNQRRPLLKTELEFQESECMSLILVRRRFLFFHVPDISDPHCLLHRQSVRPTGPVSLGKTWRNSRPSFLMPSCPVIASGGAGALSPGHALDPHVYADSALGFVTNL